MTLFTGGALVGAVNVSWPLASLKVESDELVLKAMIIGTHRFKREDVFDVAQVIWLPVLAWGVRIRHTREDVPTNVIFWSLGRPGRILDAVSRSGFLPGAPKLDSRKHSGFPFRPAFVLCAVALWNVLFLMDRWRSQPVWGLGFLCAAGAAFAGSLLVQRPGIFQRFALRSPDLLPNARGFLRLLTLVTGVMLAVGIVTSVLGLHP